MFWNSVIGGLKVLTYWEVYAAGLMYAIISLAPMIIFGLIAEKNEAIGCLGGFLIAPVFQALGTIIFVFTLFPIILGFSNEAAWSFLWKMIFYTPWGMIKSSLIILFATILLAFVPLVGRIHSLNTFLAGAISLIILLGILKKALPNIPIDKIYVIPGVLVIAGFLVIAGIFSWVSTRILHQTLYKFTYRL